MEFYSSSDEEQGIAEWLAGKSEVTVPETDGDAEADVISLPVTTEETA
jgi:hypothetical protein